MTMPASFKIDQPNSINMARLRSGLYGELVLPGDPAYETARRVWNGAIDRRPAVIARCANVQDIQRAIEFARQNTLDISVRGGGHSCPGFSTCEGGLVIDLSPMKRISVNAESQTARAEPGVTLGELIAATQMHGLVTNTGGASDTGIAGPTLGGGMGLLMGKYGLTCDNVRGFDVVTADGRLLRADGNENADLYWGLRGGGGNFGVVTAFEYQLHPVSTILGGRLVLPLSRTRKVLEFYRDFTSKMPGAAWEDGPEEPHSRWLAESWQAAKQFASPRAHINFIDDEGPARVRSAYGPNYERLVALKNKYDPDNVFQLKQNIKPNIQRAQARHS